MFLIKEEPSNYPFSAFQKDGGTTWTGVKNPLAQKHLRSIKKGDLVFFYHTGDEKAVVGIARATGGAYADPADSTGRAHVVDLAPVKALARPVTLAEIKASPKFTGWELVRLPRLTVMPVSPDHWAEIQRLAKH